jgi:hypothetical protein
MKELIPTNPAASESVTEGMVHWLLRDAYSQAFGNMPEYAGRVREVGKNVGPVPGTTQTYYTPTLGRSQHARYSTSTSQEEINRACALILEAEWGACAVEIETILEREFKAVKEQFNVLWARCEAELVSRSSCNISTAVASQDTLLACHR